MTHGNDDSDLVLTEIGVSLKQFRLFFQIFLGRCKVKKPAWGPAGGEYGLGRVVCALSVFQVILDGGDHAHTLDVGGILVAVLDGELSLARRLYLA